MPSTPTDRRIAIPIYHDRNFKKRPNNFVSEAKVANWTRWE